MLIIQILVEALIKAMKKFINYNSIHY